MASEQPSFPIFLKAPVIRGPGRGFSRRANLPSASISATPRELGDKTWINGFAFYGFASVEDGPVNKAFIGVTKYRAMDARTLKTVLEVFILNKFPSDFYGKTLKVCIVGRLEDVSSVDREGLELRRQQQEFSFFDMVVRWVTDVMARTERILELPELKAYANHEFFHSRSML